MIKPLIAMLVMNIGLLLTWTFIDPLVFKRVSTGPTSSYGVCTIEGRGVAGKVFSSLIMVINVLFALVLANVEAFRARSISDEFSEVSLFLCPVWLILLTTLLTSQLFRQSKYIAITMICILQAMIIALPLFFLIRGQPATSFVVTSAFATIIAMSLLCFMFIPKITLARKHAKAKAQKQRDKADRRNSITPSAGHGSHSSFVNVRTSGIRILSTSQVRMVATSGC